MSQRILSDEAHDALLELYKDFYGVANVDNWTELTREEFIDLYRDLIPSESEYQIITLNEIQKEVEKVTIVIRLTNKNYLVKDA